jgi:uncharacterized SAM-binding protein YcdF (DUF218 family)
MIVCQFGVPNILGICTTGGEIPIGIAGALVAQTRLYRAVIWVTISLLLLLGIISFTNVSASLVRPLIRVDTIPNDADAVVVLSGGVTNDGYLPQQGGDRVRKALELMKAHVAPVLVVTRERTREGSRGVNSAGDQDAFVRLAGVDSVIRSGWVTSTRAEAEQVSRIAAANHWKRVIVVTSPVHSRRACATFESLGMKVSCIPADSRDISLNRMTSAHDRVGAFALWLYELAGTLRYRQLGYL